MVNSRDKGNAFESDLVKLLNKEVTNGNFKRIAGSGAIGTYLHEPLLTGDITGKVEGFAKNIKIECKVGYGGDKQLTLKREWLNKIKKEADENYSFPVLIGKFSGARKSGGVQIFTVLDIDDFVQLLNTITKLSKELEEMYAKNKTD